MDINDNMSRFSPNQISSPCLNFCRFQSFVCKTVIKLKNTKSVRHIFPNNCFFTWTFFQRIELSVPRKCHKLMIGPRPKFIVPDCGI
jgi:hypothetical protein